MLTVNAILSRVASDALTLPALVMTISDANSAFLVDTYRGVAAALRGSGDCLMEYYLQAAEGLHTLRGSLVSINGSWGYIPLEQGSVRYLGNDSDVLVKMANGSGGIPLSATSDKVFFSSLRLPYTARPAAAHAASPGSKCLHRPALARTACL